MGLFFASHMLHVGKIASGEKVIEARSKSLFMDKSVNGKERQPLDFRRLGITTWRRVVPVRLDCPLRFKLKD
jgi:hypothetical protein